ncbi:C2H2 finger domain protein, putative [Paecilomyces variotii No. 5]|uniref:C2H2 finger domain protein, putative n=1 Tax=Byssochlamys spectabilis (strain No. 5 / NBRC 109023) TaxID=1356009 RepID=V5FVP0_BYSSN|nr:C2H2 finger domain protein, putative [Paecilomyces variotii No. 5]
MSTPGTASAASPDNISQTHSAFKKQASEQVYLSVPSDPDEDAFRSAAASINSRCHSPVDHDGSQISALSSPRSNANLGGEAESSHHHSGSPQNIDVDLTTLCEDYLEQLKYDDYVNDNDAGGEQRNAGPISKPTSRAWQLLSPGLTNDINSPSDIEDSTATTGTVYHHQTGTLEDENAREDSSSGRNGPSSYHLAPSPNMNGAPRGETLAAKSPVVTVSAYSRGDSPERDAPFKRTSRSSSLSNHHQRPRRGSDDHVQTVVSSPSLRADDGSWIPDSTTGQGGIDPLSRGGAQIQSPNQVEEQRKIAEKNADIQTWSAAVIAANLSRPRAKSTGDPHTPTGYFDIAPRELFFDDSHIPGPGILINEPSDGESDIVSEDESVTSKPASATGLVDSDGGPSKHSEHIVPVAGEGSLEPETDPEPRQFFRPYPWHDPPRYPIITASKEHPESSKAAIAMFLKKSKDVETASRVATWGTRRKSDPEVADSFSKRAVTGERRSSLFKRIPRIGDSSTKRKLPDSHQQRQESICISGDNKSHERKGSFTFGKLQPQRKLSVGRSKSPSLNTVSAFVAMAGQMAAVGGSGPVQAASSDSTFRSWSPQINRTRSKSDISKTSKAGIISLMETHGGPPVANIRSPSLAAPSRDAATHESIDHENGDKNKPAISQRATTMDFSVRSQPPIPTLDGFRKQIEKLNPRMPPYLIERLAREQVSRYKSLREAKTKHALAVKQNTCNAGSHCFALGGQATLLLPKTNGHDPDTTCPQYQIPGNEASDNESNQIPDAVVTSAQFPSGVSLPPVKRLPAEFECTLCFGVKKIMKPSDWTKHVHEDIYPFTCTFPHCSQPKKSFKRKADWVRHENELHRQLEWWTCSFQDCQHQCFRKNNFIQHLVREHGITMPKARKTASRKTGVKDDIDDSDVEQGIGGIASSDELWQLVEVCRHETTKTPKEEPCRFCGNVCSSWRKLTVHLAKHLEQIAMPVLQTLKDVEVSHDATAELPVPESDGQSIVLPMRSSDVKAPTSSVPASIKIEQDVAAGLSEIPTSNNLAYQSENLTVAPGSAYTSQTPAYNSLGSYVQSGTAPFNNTASVYLNVPGLMAEDAFATGYREPMYTRGDSVTYPPVFRLGTFNDQNQNPPALSYPPSNPSTQTPRTQLNVIPVYDPHRPLCASPTENLYPYPGDTASGEYSEDGILDLGVSGGLGDIYGQTAENPHHPFFQ